MNRHRATAKAIALVAAATGLTPWLRHRRRRSGPRVYILEYHGVSVTGPEVEGTISAERFRRHLRFLKLHYRIESLSRAAARLRAAENLSEDVVVVTFDDGYLDNYEAAWPVLQAEASTATIFLTTGFLDGHELWFDLARRGLAAARRAGSSLPTLLARRLEAALGTWPFAGEVEPAVYRLKRLPHGDRQDLLAEIRDAALDLGTPTVPLAWDDVRTMQAAGCEFGGHTVTHPILSILSRDRQEEEIRRSRDRITEETGHQPTTFAYPNGSALDFNDDTVAVLAEAGFDVACTTIRGSNQPGCDFLRLRRIGVGSDPNFLLAARLAGLFDDEVRRVLAR